VSAAIAVSLALAQPSRDVPMYGYEVQHVYPHDSNSFTQGLEYADGFLYEGTGLNGRSSVRRVKLETGEVLKRRDVPAQHFGEGITLWQSDLIELTWKSEVAFVYDKDTLQQRRTLTYPGEGWGITHDGTHLIMSDGSEWLRILDPTTFAERRRVRVMAAGARDSSCRPAGPRTLRTRPPLRSAASSCSR